MHDCRRTLTSTAGILWVPTGGVSTGQLSGAQMRNPRGTGQPSCGSCARIRLHSGLVLRHRDVQEVMLGRLWSGLAGNQEMATKQARRWADGPRVLQPRHLPSVSGGWIPEKADSQLASVGAQCELRGKRAPNPKDAPLGQEPRGRGRAGAPELPCPARGSEQPFQRGGLTLPHEDQQVCRPLVPGLRRTQWSCCAWARAPSGSALEGNASQPEPAASLGQAWPAATVAPAARSRFTERCPDPRKCTAGPSGPCARARAAAAASPPSHLSGAAQASRRWAAAHPSPGPHMLHGAVPSRCPCCYTNS